MQQQAGGRRGLVLHALMHRLQDQPVFLDGGLGAAGVALGDARVLRIGVALLGMPTRWTAASSGLGAAQALLPASAVSASAVFIDR